MTTIADNSEKSTNGDTENVFERKAREIINWTVSEGTRDFSALLAAIASALEAERLEGQNDIWLWLDEETTGVQNQIVKSMMARHKREVANRKD